MIESDEPDLSSALKEYSPKPKRSDKILSSETVPLNPSKVKKNLNHPKLTKKESIETNYEENKEKIISEEEEKIPETIFETCRDTFSNSFLAL